jgi:DNA-binding transcriptional LysR family regulator
MRHIATLRYIDAVAKAGSIRQAAEELNITPSALNRRIQGFEEDLGTPIFERLSHGVRLNTAGEILIKHARDQMADLERVRSQIADLSGVRRGHVSIACSQALLPYFLPEQIAAYRREHDAVTFAVKLRDRAAAEQELLTYSADIALVFEPVRLADFATIARVPQQVHAMMSANHPLAGVVPLRLSDCLRYPHALPSSAYGVRFLLERATQRTPELLQPVVESDSFEFLRYYIAHEQVVAFQIPIGLAPRPEDSSVVSRPLDARDVPPGHLLMGQLRGRTLPVASARFANQVQDTLAHRFEMV